ncbi:hypothetical protein Ddye_017035 [Dipteronia dyeriana]|uniref:Uncharacterized protein n=1 Tax=Dipteronia dyeriana TaxID=168575 RepID=A0AAD9X047_9ROSI|nr:hypothetical protein Ddye_017035 [Dipteronia dyeriana]
MAHSGLTTSLLLLVSLTIVSALPNSILNKDKLKITECKVLLESSPLKTCKVPTNINKGLTGSPLHTYRLLKDKKMKL